MISLSDLTVLFPSVVGCDSEITFLCPNNLEMSQYFSESHRPITVMFPQRVPSLHFAHDVTFKS